MKINNPIHKSEEDFWKETYENIFKKLSIKNEGISFGLYERTRNLTTIEFEKKFNKSATETINRIFAKTYL